jgi:hypothetical protein
MDRPVRRAVHRKVRRAGVVPDQHRASEQQTSKWLIHGTGPVPGSPAFFRRPFYRFRRRNKVPGCEYGAWGGGRDEGRLPAQKLDCFAAARNDELAWALFWVTSSACMASGDGASVGFRLSFGRGGLR